MNWDYLSWYIVRGVLDLPSALFYFGRRYLDAFLSSMIVTIGVALSHWMSLVPSVNWNSQKDHLKPKPTTHGVRVQSGMAFYIELMCHVLGWFFWPRPMRHSMQLSCNWEGVPSNECSNQWDIYCSGKWRLNVSRTRFFWMWRCTVFGSSFWSLWKTFNGYPISTSTSIAYQRCYPGKPC